MANTLRFKRGLVSGIPTAALGEPLFTTDTFDLYIGNGTGNTRFQKYIASGTTSQLLRGDGSLLTMPIVLTSPANGEVLKYNGTNWVNSSDAGVTGSATAGQVTFWNSASTITGSNNLFWDATNNRLGIGTNAPSYTLDLQNSNGSLLARFKDSDSTHLGIVIAGDINGGWVGNNSFIAGEGIYYQNSANAMRFYTNSVERMRLISTGNLHIGGTTDNGLRFQVTGDGFFSGSVGIGTTSLTATSFRVNKAMTGGVTALGIYHTGQVQSDVTATAYGNYNVLNTAASSFTLTNYFHYATDQGTIGAGSAVTNQYGFFAGSSIVGATNNFGFYGNIASGTGRWNLYMNGSANNFLNGGLAIAGTTLNANALLQINANAFNDNRVILISNTNAGTSAQAAIQLTSNAGTASFNVYSSAFGITEFASTALLSSGLMANGLLLNTATTSPIVFRTNSTERMRLDASGNLGLGVTPSAWGSNSKPLQMADGSIWGSSALTGYVSVGGNYYYDGNYKYIKSSTATDYYQYNGVHAWRNAISGTANGTISFVQRMTLDASGNLGLGVVPSAWISTAKAMQVGSASFVGVTGTSDAFAIGGNYYINSSNQYVYLTSTNANRFEASLGEFRWLSTGSGTAGDVFTFTQRMTLTAAGRLLLGSGAATSELMQVNGTMRVSGESLFGSNLGGANRRVANFRNTGGNGYIEIQASGAGAIALWTDAQNAFGIYKNTTAGTLGANLFLITNTENIGIGTTTPAYKLDVNGTFGATGAATFSSSVTAGGNILASSSIGDISLKSAVVGDYFPRMYLERTGGTTRTNRLWSFAIGTNGGLYINDTTGSIDALILNASTGAATFSSSVTGASFIPTSSSIPTNGMYLPSANSLGFATNGTLDMTINSRGDIGVGVTPSTWSLGKSIEINSAGQGITSLQLGDTLIMNGVYYNSSLRYANSSYAISLYRQFRGVHSWYYAPQGTIGNTVTFDIPMTLETTGNLLLGSTTDDTVNRLQVTGSGTFSSSVTSTQFNLSALNTAPATSSSTGTLGEIRIDADHIYVCTATNTWKRVAISTF